MFAILALNFLSFIALWFKEIKTHKTKEGFKIRYELYKEILEPLHALQTDLNLIFSDEKLNSQEKRKEVEKLASRIRASSYKEALLFATNKVIDSYSTFLRYVEHQCVFQEKYDKADFDTHYHKLINSIREDIGIKPISFYSAIDSRRLTIKLLNIALNFGFFRFSIESLIKFIIYKLSFNTFLKTENKLNLKKDYFIFKKSKKALNNVLNKVFFDNASFSDFENLLEKELDLQFGLLGATKISPEKKEKIRAKFLTPAIFNITKFIDRLSRL